MLLGGTPPAFGKPATLALRTGVPLPSALAASGLPAMVSWAAADAGSGIDRYTLARSTDGGTAWTAVALPSPTATSAGVTVPASGTVRYRVPAHDTAGNTSDSVTPVLTPRLVQQSSRAVV